jgi:hypothetical protein
MGPFLATDRYCSFDPRDLAVYTLSWKYTLFLSFQAASCMLVNTVYSMNL